MGWLLCSPSPSRCRRQLDALAAQAALELAARFDADLTLRAPGSGASAGGRRAGGAGRCLLARALDPSTGRTASGWLRGRGGPSMALHLPDGRWLLVKFLHRHRGAGLLLALLALAAAVGLGAYPLARRITRRLERLQARVDALGAGDLEARVEVEGRDEVAELARSFNRAAARIGQLVAGHKTLLAHVSHELRSPLARMRMALELLPGDERPELKARLTRDIAELDGLIGELLLASRLDTLDGLMHTEEVDLLALAAEEAAEHGAEVSGEPVTIEGDPRLLRRLLRNLLDNAYRYAGGQPVEVTVSEHACRGAGPSRRSRPRRTGSGARAHLRALLPLGGCARNRGRRGARTRAGAPDRAATWRHGALRGARRRRHRVRGRAGQGRRVRAAAGRRWRYVRVDDRRARGGCGVSWQPVGLRRDSVHPRRPDQSTA